jgi:hypothetical protein
MSIVRPGIRARWHRNHIEELNMNLSWAVEAVSVRIAVLKVA